MPTSKFRSASAEDQRESVGVETLSKLSTEVFVGFECKTIVISVQTTRFTLFAQVGQRHETGGEDSKDVPAQSIRQNLLLNTARAAEAAAAAAAAGESYY